MAQQAEEVDTRTARRDLTINRILDAAWKLARRNGIAAIVLGDIAKEVGMRAPSLYTYFPSKLHIYDAMYEQGFRLYAEQWDSVRWSEDPRERLFQRAREFVRISCEDPYRYELLFQRPIPGFVPSEKAFQVSVSLFAGLRGELEAVGLASEASLAMWRALLTGLIGMQIANDPGGDSFIKFVDDAVEMLLNRHAGSARKTTSKKRGKQ